MCPGTPECDASGVEATPTTRSVLNAAHAGRLVIFRWCGRRWPMGWGRSSDRSKPGTGRRAQMVAVPGRLHIDDDEATEIRRQSDHHGERHAGPWRADDQVVIRTRSRAGGISQDLVSEPSGRALLAFSSVWACIAIWQKYRQGQDQRLRKEERRKILVVSHKPAHRSG